MYDVLDSSQYNGRMAVSEFMPIAEDYLLDLPFAAFHWDPARLRPFLCSIPETSNP